MATVAPAAADSLLLEASDNPLNLSTITSLPERKRRGARLRKSTPKVRSGCITCKKRRVKCDETKPACLNCQRLKNTKCEGYDIPKAWVFRSQSEQGRQTSLPLPPTPGSNAISPDEHGCEQNKSNAARKAFYDFRSISSSFGTNEESRSFAYYLHVTGPIMSKRSEPWFWSTLVTRAAWQYECVKYALTALSQIDEAIDLAQLRMGKYVASVKPNDIRQRALQTYSAAVRTLMSGRHADIEAVLISCICLFAFENFIGNLELATKHLEGAVGLVQNWKIQQMQNGKWKSENVVMARHVIPMIEAGQAYHRISMKAGKTAARVLEPKEHLKSEKLDWNGNPNST